MSPARTLRIVGAANLVAGAALMPFGVAGRYVDAARHSLAAPPPALAAWMAAHQIGCLVAGCILLASGAALLALSDAGRRLVRWYLWTGWTLVASRLLLSCVFAQHPEWQPGRMTLYESTIPNTGQLLASVMGLLYPPLLLLVLSNPAVLAALGAVGTARAQVRFGDDGGEG